MNGSEGIAPRQRREREPGDHCATSGGRPSSDSSLARPQGQEGKQTQLGTKASAGYDQAPLSGKGVKTLDLPKGTRILVHGVTTEYWFFNFKNRLVADFSIITEQKVTLSA